MLVHLPLVRIQLRCPSPAPSVHASRSGALVLDLHDVRLSAGPTAARRPVTRFADVHIPPSSLDARTAEGSPGSTLLSAECRRIVVACSAAGEGKASALASIGSLGSMESMSASVQDFRQSRAGAALPLPDALSPLQPRVSVTRLQPRRSSFSASPNSATLAVNVDVPSVHVDLSKCTLDALQYWADDAAQLAERVFGGAGGDTDTEKADSRDTSLIGSRFFARSRRSNSGSVSGASGDAGSENVVEVTISEGQLLLHSAV